jgi:hypothetical protein
MLKGNDVQVSGQDVGLGTAPGYVIPRKCPPQEVRTLKIG